MYEEFYTLRGIRLLFLVGAQHAVARADSWHRLAHSSQGFSVTRWLKTTTSA
jgi:hypothetical protein